jgi:hypothetical protein
MVASVFKWAATQSFDFSVCGRMHKIMNCCRSQVSESHSGLSNETRYEAKPIVDTLANLWGGERRVLGLVYQ